jgi:poly(3-hydroxybutyrate) depolymerase
MIRPRSLLTLALCSTAAAWSVAGCSTSSDGSGGAPAQAGAGTSPQAGSASSGSPGSSGSSAGGQSGSAAGGAAPTGSAGAGIGGAGVGGAGVGGAGVGGAAPVGGAGGRSGGAGGGAVAGGGGSATGGSGGTAMPGMSAGCGKAPTLASTTYNNGNPITITAANMQRRYILRVPTNYDNSKPYKLVIAYHARDSNDHTVYTQNYYGLSSLSNNTTIFVAPNGQKNGAPCAGTAVGESGCGWPNTSDQDMALADAVVKQVEDNFCVDTNRIFATGWSYGASMSEQTACERPLGGAQTAPWGLRAVATYAVAYLSNSTQCKISKPVAYYGTHGTCDSVLTYDGSARCSTTTGGEKGGVGVAKDWAIANGCTWVIPPKVTSGAHICTKLAGCTAGYPVEFCSHSGDHTGFPDNNNEQTSWGPAEAWAFLNQF